MELLHDFLTKRCNLCGQDFSFSTFRQQWKAHRMNYIFMIKHKNEPLPAFMNECNEYLTNCIYYNFAQCKFSNADHQLSCYAVYILYVLITQQPCFEDNSPPTYISLPEYAWNALKHLIDFALQQQLKDLTDILRHMVNKHYFVYCIERPIVYSTSKTDPYSKQGKIYCHNTASRIELTPTDLVSVMDVPMLASRKQQYQNALRQCGPEYNHANNEQFIEKLRAIRSQYQHKLSKLQRNRMQAQGQFTNIKFPLQFSKPATMSDTVLKEYHECCRRYQAAIDVFTLDKSDRAARETAGQQTVATKTDEHKANYQLNVPRSLHSNHNHNHNRKEQHIVDLANDVPKFDNIPPFPLPDLLKIETDFNLGTAALPPLFQSMSNNTNPNLPPFVPQPPLLSFTATPLPAMPASTAFLPPLFNNSQPTDMNTNTNMSLDMNANANTANQNFLSLPPITNIVPSVTVPQQQQQQQQQMQSNVPPAGPTFAEIFGHNDDNEDDEDDDIRVDSSTEDEIEEKKKQSENEKQPKQNTNKKKKPVVMDVDSGSESSGGEQQEVEIEMDEKTKAEMEALEQSKKLLAITAENQRETFDILRNLDDLEESVTNQKLENSTIEQLNIDWKKRRRQTLRIERRQDTIRRRLKRQKEREKEKNNQPQQQQQQQQQEPEPNEEDMTMPENADQHALQSDNDIDFDLDDNIHGNQNEGTFDHLLLAQEPLIQNTQSMNVAQETSVDAYINNDNNADPVKEADEQRLDTQLNSSILENDSLFEFTPTIPSTMNLQSISGLQASSMEPAVGVNDQEDIDLNMQNGLDQLQRVLSDLHEEPENVSIADAEQRDPVDHGETIKQETEDVVIGNETHDLLAELDAFSSTL